MQKRTQLAAAIVAALAVVFFVAARVADGPGEPEPVDVRVQVTPEAYRLALSEMFADGWDGSPLPDVRASLLDLTVPAELKDLHLELVVALGQPRAAAVAAVDELRAEHRF